MMRLSIVLLALFQSALGVEGPLPAPVAPPGLEVELRAVGAKTTFSLSEPVPLEVSFRSSTPSTCRIEVADGWNGAPATDSDSAALIGGVAIRRGEARWNDYRRIVGRLFQPA